MATPPWKAKEAEVVVDLPKKLLRRLTVAGRAAVTAMLVPVAAVAMVPPVARVVMVTMPAVVAMVAEEVMVVMVVVLNPLREVQ